MGTLRYPDNVDNRETPYVLFQTKRAQYTGRGDQTLLKVDNEYGAVAIYMPQNISVADSQRYETTSTGVVGALYDVAGRGGNVTLEDIRAAGLANPDVVAGAIGAGVGAATGGAGSAVVGAVTSASAVGGIAAEAQKDIQQTLNPREFMLFKAPTIRTFSFEFTFCPKTVNEADSVPTIIKYFRQASYPVSSGFTYNFPPAFVVKFANSDNMIKLPQVVCTSVTTSYNPNAQSYFTRNNFPVEVTLQLSFQELQPIDSQLVEQGF